MGIEEQILEMKKQEGREENKAEMNNLFVENLIRSTNFSNKRIASLAAVPVSFVEEVRNKISQ